QGYGGFNFSVLSTQLNVGRSTLYEYYASKDELVADYMTELMVTYTNELNIISQADDAEEQMIKLIQLMIKYAHIHDVLQMIPLMQSESEPVQKIKEKFIDDNIYITNYINDIYENDKKTVTINNEIS